MTGWIAGHSRSVLFAFILLVLGGVGAALKLPVALFPQISFPRVVVSVDAGEKAADQVEVQITRPLEQALRAVPGVQEIRSTTSRGAADLALTFSWGQNMTTATLQAEVGAPRRPFRTCPPGPSSWSSAWTRRFIRFSASRSPRHNAIPPLCGDSRSFSSDL